MNNIKAFKLTFFLLLFSFSTFSQNKDSLSVARVLSLEDVIKLAKQQSIAYYYAVNLKENKYWQWRTYKSNYLPQLSLSGTLPDFNRAYVPVTQQDGTTKYQYISNSNSNVSLNLNQSVGATGGTIFARSILRRFDNFNSRHEYNYGGNPFEIGYQQSIFGFNRLLWDRRIEPLKYEESQKEYIEQLENISIEGTKLFFNVLIAQINYQIAEKNQANNDTIYKIAKGRYNLGKIGEDELLQVELSLMNARQAVAQSELDLKTNSLQLKIFGGITDEQPISLSVPDSIPMFEVSEEVALSEARKNRSAIIAFQRRLLEAESGIAEARGNNGLQTDLFATYGFTNTAAEVPEMYRNSIDQQALRVGFTIPIVDWGRSKSRIKTAIANQKLVKNAIEQEELNFNQEVTTRVGQFKMLRDQIEITSKADQIGEKRYHISKNRYLIGKIDITNFNIAAQEKDKAKRDFVQSLRDFWVVYFELRKLTLFDFAKNGSIN